MSEVTIEVGLVEADFEIVPTSVEIDVVPASVQIYIDPPDLLELNVTPPPLLEVTFTTNDVSLVVNPPPLVNFSVGGGTGNGTGGSCYVPVGGAKNYVLAKRTDADLDVEWQSPGIATYRTPDQIPSSPRKGDLRFDADNNNLLYRFDGIQWVDVHDQNIDVVMAIAESNAGDISNNQDEIENLHNELDILQTTTDNAEKTANTADGRISMSDYEPTPDDITYPVTKIDPDTGEEYIDEIPRIEGSLWFQRTRPRRNLLTNPSMEKNALGWQATASTIVREAHGAATDLAGSYCLRVTNTAANAWVEPSYTFPVAETQWIAASGYIELISGSGKGCFVTIGFYDAGNALLLSFMGEVEDLVQGITDPHNWNRLNAVAQAPAGTVYARTQFHNPNAADVWYQGASIVEGLDELGKYFDGDSYDGYWEGGTGDPVKNPDDNPTNGEQGWQESTSRLRGDKIIGVWELHAEAWVRKVFTDTTLDYIDASKITNLEKFLPADNSIYIDKIAVPLITPSENLGAGDIVNTYNASGSVRCRKANASAGLNYTAHGFVLVDVVAGTPVRVYPFGTDIVRISMAPGPQWLSETAGRVIGVPPATVGATVQQVGFAADLVHLNFHPLSPVRII